MTTRALAVAAYLAATAAPAAADWRAIADQLHTVLTAKRAPKAEAWFADWTLGKVYSLDSLDVTFADGVAVRVNLAKAPGKLPRVAAACRTAVAFYRARTGLDSVPAFASLTTVSDGATFDAEACSARTADLRVTGRVAPAVRPAVTVEAVERMAREVERRRAGLAASLAMPDRIAAHVIPLCLSWDARGRAVAELNAMKESAALAGSWRAAIEAGEAELSAMRAALAPAEAPAAPVEAEPAPVAVEASPAAAEPVPAPVEPAPAAVPPVEAIAEAVDHIEPLAICPAVGLPCKVDCGFRSTCGLPAADVDAAAVEAVEAEPAPALCASDDAGDWHPDESTHPVTALCLSPKARDALFARVQDGTFPADGRAAKAGAWRLSLADAAACAGIPSVRLIGLPRKPRTARAAPPVVTIRTPVEAITIVSAAAIIPGAGAPPAGAYPYHAAPAL